MDFPRRGALCHGELAKVEAEPKKLANAVAGGVAVQTLLEGMTACEAERRALLAQFEDLDGPMKAAACYKAYLAAWKVILPDWHQAVAGHGAIRPPVPPQSPAGSCVCKPWGV